MSLEKMNTNKLEGEDGLFFIYSKKKKSPLEKMIFEKEEMSLEKRILKEE